MNEITLDNEHYECAENESVLDCLLRNNIQITHSCKMGTCQTCLLRAENAEIPSGARFGLASNLIAQNYFLSCMFFPDTSITVLRPDATGLYQPANVIEKKYLAKDVLQLILEPHEVLTYYAGQFINLKQDQRWVRSYSLASDPAETSLLELHIKRLPNGRMSNWLFDDLHVHDEILFQGPNGHCFYLNNDLEQSVLLIGTGTGLAPLLGIVHSALSQGHRGPIFLYHGTRNYEGLYLDAELNRLSTRVKNFAYISCLSGDDGSNGASMLGRVNEIAFLRHNDLTGWQVFLCGEPNMVKQSEQRAYLLGAELNKIHSDPFNLKDLRGRLRN